MEELKVQIQKIGAFLSGMVMPNIGAFIAWGILTALFIPAGWFPNETMNKLVSPTLTYLMPILLGYTGGKMVYDKRGGVAGALATMGVVIGADITMLIGGMVMGPLGAWVMKKVDKCFEGRVKPGLEMLVDNFSMGIVGALLMAFGFIAVEPVFNAVLTVLSAGVNWLVAKNLLPLTAIFVQPAQVLFLNNAINHGIMIPLGVEQAAKAGKSILFLVEANGGVWTGVALGFAIWGKGMAKKSAPAATIIMGVGGIAEVTFPYVLSKPKTIIAPILGNMAGLFTLTALHGGTVAAVSPGSFFALLAMTPKGSFVANIAGYVVALVVTALLVGIILKFDKTEDMDELPEVNKPNFGKTTGNAKENIKSVSGKIEKLFFACDAGMGSSVMGVSLMKKKVEEAGLGVTVEHISVKNLTDEPDMIVTTNALKARVEDTISKYDKQIPVFGVDNLLDEGNYDELISMLKENNAGKLTTTGNETINTIHTKNADKTDNTNSIKNNSTNISTQDDMDCTEKETSSKNPFPEENILLNVKVADKTEAIRLAGNLLKDHGYVEPEYIDAMIQRDKEASVYLGNHFAIPHGVAGSEKYIKESGISFLQIPDGVDFNGETAYVMVGIAGKNGEHIEILGNIAEVCTDVGNVEKLRTAKDKKEVLDIFKNLR
ncbi:PTS mannitol transporter subunit IICBA [Anaerobutyricum soehngenii]|uniref:PTS mannitol transporter subunit IICBA n=1 Tax=Anaerobutyricum soehngenii TaxID=105843 RepID=UPI001EDA0A5B|nr:PTS mannitol transporter subunit IICBA [Anaerobutyricum soehngenii]MCG4697732.1 PTS mannitol transporter subunit IICBA [Anaerobutyricum soehngenii]